MLRTVQIEGGIEVTQGWVRVGHGSRGRQWLLISLVFSHSGLGGHRDRRASSVLVYIVAQQ